MKRMDEVEDRETAGIQIILFAFIASMVLFLAAACLFCAFDADEFQHLETAWLIATGEIPYKDFFEHHTPLYHFLIAPLLAKPEITVNGDAAVRMILKLRLLGVALCGGVLAMTYITARQFAGRITALFSCALLASSIVFIQKGIEIRPDQLGAIFLLATTSMLLLASQSRQWLWLCLLAGVAATLAVLTTQKILMAGPGLAFTFIYVLRQRRPRPSGIAAAFAAVFMGGVIAALPFLLYFQSHGALEDFIANNFLLGAKWKHIGSTIPWILSLMGREDALLILLAGVGALSWPHNKPEIRARQLAVLAPLFSMAIMMPLFPVVQRQYIFLFMPYAAMLGGLGAAALTQAVAIPKHKFLQPALVLPFVIALHAISLEGHELSLRNTGTLDETRYIISTTSPQDTVMGAWSAGIAFRKPAFFYPVLHEEIRPLVSGEKYAQLLRGLRDGTITPALVDMDKDMQQLPPEIVKTLQKGWEPTGVGTLLRRKGNPGR